MLDLERDLGDDLHRARPGADDADALALERDVVVPAGGVERLALEVGDARDVGDARLVEDAGGADHVAGGDLAAALDSEAPVMRVLVEDGAGHL